MVGLAHIRLLSQLLSPINAELQIATKNTSLCLECELKNMVPSYMKASHYSSHSIPPSFVPSVHPSLLSGITGVIHHAQQSASFLLTFLSSLHFWLNPYHANYYFRIQS